MKLTAPSISGNYNGHCTCNESVAGTLENETEIENERLLIPAVQNDIYHRIKFNIKIDLRLT